jgi:Fe2+ transport system protein FeoA
MPNSSLIKLSELAKYQIGIVRQIDLPDDHDVTNQLLEMGITDGVRLEVLHLGYINNDPIAVRINNSSTITALRKREAEIIFVELQ